MYGLVLDSRKKDREELFVNTAARKGLDKAMRAMIFGESPSFDELMAAIRELETEINILQFGLQTFV